MPDFEKNVLDYIVPDQAYRKALETLKVDALDPNDFVDLYGKENVENDLVEVRQKEVEIGRSDTLEEKRLSRLATIFEAIMHEQIELSDWLGPNAYTIKTSRFDDLKNGVDEIVEFEEGESRASHLALAIDLALGSELDKKFERIKEEIKSGELSQIKYFKSKIIPDFKKRLTKVPRVVIAADKQTFQRLVDLWLEGKNKALARDMFQFSLLEQMRVQLEGFKAYAEKLDKTDIAQNYQRDLSIIEEIIKRKKEELKPDEAELAELFENDKILDVIYRNLRSLRLAA